MSDLKLFKLSPGQVTELPVSSMALEKFRQTRIENHLETFLGVTFLASGYSTGPKTDGRIHTLGIDDNGAPSSSNTRRRPTPASSTRDFATSIGSSITVAISRIWIAKDLDRRSR